MKSEVLSVQWPGELCLSPSVCLSTRAMFSVQRCIWCEELWRNSVLILTHERACGAREAEKAALWCQRSTFTAGKTQSRAVSTQAGLLAQWAKGQLGSCRVQIRSINSQGKFKWLHICMDTSLSLCTRGLKLKLDEGHYACCRFIGRPHRCLIKKQK